MLARDLYPLDNAHTGHTIKASGLPAAAPTQTAGYVIYALFYIDAQGEEHGPAFALGFGIVESVVETFVYVGEFAFTDIEDREAHLCGDAGKKHFGEMVVHAQTSRNTQIGIGHIKVVFLNVVPLVGSGVLNKGASGSNEFLSHLTKLHKSI